jgi:hypothetical protein
LSLINRSRFGPVLTALFAFISASFRTRAALQLEILALRHQICILQRSVKTPEAERSGPLSLGVALLGLERLAIGCFHHQGRHGDRLAAQGL